MAFHFYDITELYSNANGTVQFIELFTSVGNQQFLSTHQISSTNGVTNTLTFASDRPADSTNTSVLIATQGFADLGIVVPDYIIADGFLFSGGGTVNFGLNQDIFVHGAIPTSGTLSLYRNGTTATASPENFAGAEGSIPGNPIVGTAGANTLNGTSAKDFMVGIGGNDRLNGSGGNDTLDGGAGADTMIGGNGNDRLIGEAGNDSMNGGTGTDNLNGGAGNDILIWGAGDTINGATNTDTLKITVASLDLTTASNPNSRLLNIEQIDLRAGAHTLKLNTADVLAMSPTDQIKILGDGADTVNIVGTQSAGTPAANGFTRYTIGAATLLIDSDIYVT